MPRPKSHERTALRKQINHCKDRRLTKLVLAPKFQRVDIPVALKSTATYRLPKPSGTATGVRGVFHGQPISNSTVYNPALHALEVSACMACGTIHRLGSCPLKTAGVEHCNLCGIAHFGHGRICPHINSETQVREMLAALKQSPEPGHLVREARKYLTGLKGTLVQKKKIDMEKAKARVQAAQGNAVAAAATVGHVNADACV